MHRRPGAGEDGGQAADDDIGGLARAKSGVGTREKTWTISNKLRSVDMVVRERCSFRETKEGE